MYENSSQLRIRLIVAFRESAEQEPLLLSS